MGVSVIAIREPHPLFVASLADGDFELKILWKLSNFSLLQASLSASDTVTLLKCHACKEMRDLVRSCYIDVTGTL